MCLEKKKNMKIKIYLMFQNRPDIRQSHWVKSPDADNPHKIYLSLPAVVFSHDDTDACLEEMPDGTDISGKCRRGSIYVCVCLA